jgi:hypothetical protein
VFTVEVNADATPSTGRADAAIQGGAEAVLPLLEAALD